MKKILLLVCIIVGCWKWFGSNARVHLGEGVMVAEPPKQVSISRSEMIHLQDYSIKPLAHYDISAKVLAKKSYYFGREADLSPLDFALGWQNMSDEQHLEKITISQSNRWYHWRVQQFPIPRQQIESQSANTHLIPANDTIASQLSRIKQGEVVRLQGYLVEVTAQDGWKWQSSLTRSDTGNHACEVMYVNSIDFISRYN